MKNIVTVADLYQYLDNLFDQNVDSDTLFASSYLRGVFSSAASSYADEHYAVSIALIQAVTDKLSQTKIELSPQDSALVQNFWLQLKVKLNPLQTA